MSRTSVSYKPAGRRRVLENHAVVAWNGGSGPSRRVPESREHVARARHGAAQGNRDPSRAWGQSHAHRATTSYRRFCARVTRWRRRTDSWSLVVRSARRFATAFDAARYCLAKWTESDDPGGDVWILFVGTLAFALGPALKISRRAVIGDLKQQAGEDVVTRRWKFLPRHPLVVIQIAFSLALLTAAALFIRGAGKAASVDTGLKPGASFFSKQTPVSPATNRNVRKSCIAT